MCVQKFLFISIFLGFFFQADLVNSLNLTCHADDLKALDEFHSALASKIDRWGSNYSTNCCNWAGVTCAQSSSFLGQNQLINSSRVVKLELPGLNLTGKLPESIGGLSQLKLLNLSSNSLHEVLPISLFHFPNLEVLDLGSNDFSGTMAVSINLPSIRFFGVPNNHLHGFLRLGICVNSTRIEVLNLAFNSFSGTFPAELANCTSLKELNLGGNFINGGILDEAFAMQKLTHLSIRNNNLSGPLNHVVGNLTNLVRLDISSNGFSGVIPDVFYNSRNLSYFVADSNDFTGNIPASLSSSSSLISLSLRNNSIEGTLDINCSAMTSLVSLDLGTNRFHGSIPSNLPSCKQLRSVNLARNNMKSQIPESFKNFHSLSFLSLTKVTVFNVSSAFNILQHCQNLNVLVLTFNFHGEEFPADPTFHFENLEVLVVANCELKGMIPQWLRSCTKLQLLDLSWNHLQGTIPAWFGEFPELFYLDLSNNSFTGEIPKQITEMQSFVSRQISSDAEPIFPFFPFFMKRNGSGLQYNQIWRFPPTLNLSDNFLIGPIWPEFGNLKRIQVLDLKMNNLSGPIPSSLSEMSSLETLDLSHNNLSGTIPVSLQKLSFLSVFSVAYNQLQGGIPKGGQFHTFSNSSFEGNKFCGDLDFCSSVDQSPLFQSHSSKRAVVIITIMIVGFVVGISFLAILVALIKRWSHRARVGDPEREVSKTGYDFLEETDLGILVMFQNKEANGGLSFSDILQSTNEFDQANIIGCGGFGLVYKAVLPDGRKVAIKRLSGDCCQMEREFRAEVETLSSAHHPNLVLLQGYGLYKKDRFLIYSFMENGSLDYWLHEKTDGPSFLNWDMRLQIARGAAKGLAYLHQSCEPHILHRDIKSSNILLDEDFIAHLADFGLARLVNPYETHVSTDIVGTLGYIPPEYGQSSMATYKGDVYSFGVVLLELLTGRRPVDLCQPKGGRDLISWVFRMKSEGRESEVFDPFIYEKEWDEEMIRVLEIACLCLSEVPKERPSTQQLVSLLGKII